MQRNSVNKFSSSESLEFASSLRGKPLRKEVEMSIGVFDSGIGGITLLHRAMELLPHESWLFYADTDNVPYGTKTREQVTALVDGVMRFMAAHECKAVVIACNTATAVAVEAMRRKYAFPIIGIEPAVKPAVARSHGKRVLVAATPLTVKEEKLKNLVERVDDSHLVDLVALPGLVELAERGAFGTDEAEQYLKFALSGYDLAQYGELVLGCTHFNYFKDSFRRLLPDGVCMIDGSGGTVRQLARVLSDRGLTVDGETENDTRVRYFCSGREITDTDGLAYMRKLHERLEEMERL